MHNFENSFLEQKVEPYRFFETKAERQELAYFCEKIADYLHDEHIQNMVCVDRSSRLAYIGIKLFWGEKYPDEKSPNIYFVNPMGFIPTSQLNNREINQLMQNAVWKGNNCQQPAKLRSQDDIVNELDSAYRKLSGEKDKPILIFDSCIHTGETLLPVINSFNKAGFSEIRIGTIMPPDDDSNVKADFYITDEEPERACYPFDRDGMVDKNLENVYSSKIEDVDKINRSLALRKEIRRIIKEYIKDSKHI